MNRFPTSCQSNSCLYYLYKYKYKNRAQQELKTTREQYTQEKSRLYNELDDLKKTKIELQVDIGHLLRDKRSTELELEAAQRHRHAFKTVPSL